MLRCVNSATSRTGAHIYRPDHSLVAPLITSHPLYLAAGSQQFECWISWPLRECENCAARYRHFYIHSVCPTADSIASHPLHRTGFKQLRGWVAPAHCSVLRFLCTRRVARLSLLRSGSLLFESSRNSIWKQQMYSPTYLLVDTSWMLFCLPSVCRRIGQR